MLKLLSTLAVGALHGLEGLDGGVAVEEHSATRRALARRGSASLQ